MKLGFVGVGVMGSAMAGHLAKAGHEVAVYDIDPGAVKRTAAGSNRIHGAASPREVGEHAEVTFTMLPNGEVVRDTLFGKKGLAEGLAEGKLLVDTSSSEPWITKESAAALAKIGVDLVDAPVSGAVEGAQTASLVFMVGGDPGPVARARPLLEIMGPTVFHLGPVGSGHVMKTINNLITAVTLASTAEAVLIGKAYGLTPSIMVDVLNVSTGMSFVSKTKIKPQAVERRFDDPFKLELMFKDVRIANDLAQSLGVPVPVSALGQQLYCAADKMLGPNRSVISLVEFYEELSGVVLEDAPAKSARKPATKRKRPAGDR